MSVAVVLAAGASSRMGTPKALLEYDGLPALVRIERACLTAGVERVVAVVGAQAPELARALRPALDARTRLVAHAEWARGRTGSLQAGLTALRAADARALVWPVDHPLATAATARALLEAAGEWVVPEHGGRGGHPVVLGPAAAAAVLAAQPEAPLRDVLSGAGFAAVRLPVVDRGVGLNLDTPEAARAAGERHR